MLCSFLLPLLPLLGVLETRGELAYGVPDLLFAAKGSRPREPRRELLQKLRFATMARVRSRAAGIRARASQRVPPASAPRTATA